MSTKKALFCKSIFGSIAFLGGVSIAAAFFYYPSYETRKRRIAVKNALENGSCPTFDETKAENYFAREDLEKKIKEIVSPTKRTGYYCLISGEHGTGKTTLVRKVCSDIKKGIVYIEVPEGERFPQHFGKAIGLDFNRPNSETPIASTFEAQYEQVRETLKEAAYEYAQSHKKPLVLVVDNIDQLAKQNPGALEILQDFAKDCADKEIIRTVFVTSEGRAPRIMQTRSAWSRLKKPPLEIGDIPDDQAIKYLTDKCQIQDAALAKKVVQEVTGGRFVMLSQYADDLKTKPYEEIKAGIMNSTAQEFQNAGLLTESPQHDAGVKLIKALLSKDNKTVTREELNSLIPQDEMQNTLLQHQVFSYHPSDHTVTFQSRAAESYASVKFRSTTQ